MKSLTCLSPASISCVVQTDAGFDRGCHAVRTHRQREQAEVGSRRLYGPFHEVDEPFIDYRQGDEELFAAVFTSRVIEPEAARRTAPLATTRIEEIPFFFLTTKRSRTERRLKQYHTGRRDCGVPAGALRGGASSPALLVSMRYFQILSKIRTASRFRCVCTKKRLPGP